MSEQVKSIVILNGSPRKNGRVANILKTIAEAASNKYEINWFDVYDLKFRPCLGCMKCRPDKECVLSRDDAHQVGEKIREADALVVGTPTYWGNMSGPLKTLFDRNVPVFEYVDHGFPSPRQKGKKAVIVTACSASWPYYLLGFQARGAVHAVETVLKSGGYRIVGTLIVANTVNAIRTSALEKAKRIGARF